jgi:hypothetical protein
LGLKLDLAAERSLTEVIALGMIAPLALGWFWLMNAMSGRASIGIELRGTLVLAQATPRPAVFGGRSKSERWCAKDVPKSAFGARASAACRAISRA